MDKKNEIAHKESMNFGTRWQAKGPQKDPNYEFNYHPNYEFKIIAKKLNIVYHKITYQVLHIHQEINEQSSIVLNPFNINKLS